MQMLLQSPPIGRYPKIRAKAVALPVEHGSWGFLIEPLVAGIVIAPSTASTWVATLVIGTFLLRQPLKVILSGGKSARQLPQTALAFKFVFAYAAVLCAGAIGCILYVRPESFVPFALVIPFVAYQIYCDATRNSRQLFAEIIGSVAISSSIAVIVLADGWDYPKAFALWAVMSIRFITSIIYVRNRLNLEKGKKYSVIMPVSAHIFGAAIVLVLAVKGLSPYMMVLMFSVLLTRCSIGLSSYRKKVKAIKIGIAEVVYGSLTVLCLVVGYYASI